MADYIDRQAAIDKLKKWSDGYRYIEVETEYAINQFKALPSEDVETVRHGRWKQAMLDHEAFGERPFIYYCSKCCQCVVSKTSYCCNCGARMDGGQGE